VPYSEYERFKWEVLMHTAHRAGLGGAWLEAKKLASGDVQKQEEFARRVVLELLDEGLIFGAYASEEDGYDLELQEFEPVDRTTFEAEVSRSFDLDRPLTYVPPGEPMFWVFLTERGGQVLDSLPPAAFLTEDSESWLERIERDYPGLLEKRDKWVRAMVKWVEKGGKRPKPPELPPDW
jgi:hypothetical protein